MPLGFRSGVQIIVGDGIAHIAEMKTYDVILIDSTDPVGAAFGTKSSMPMYKA